LGNESLHFLFESKRAMHLSNENLLVIILVGLIAGWLAGQVMRGSGFGLVGDLIGNHPIAAAAPVVDTYRLI
jgi:F0F1-type ATP synthase assembly protein I